MTFDCLKMNFLYRSSVGMLSKQGWLHWALYFFCLLSTYSEENSSYIVQRINNIVKSFFTLLYANDKLSVT